MRETVSSNLTCGRLWRTHLPVPDGISSRIGWNYKVQLEYRLDFKEDRFVNWTRYGVFWWFLVDHMAPFRIYVLNISHRILSTYCILLRQINLTSIFYCREVGRHNCVKVGSGLSRGKYILIERTIVPLWVIMMHKSEYQLVVTFTPLSGLSFGTFSGYYVYPRAL